MNHKLEMKEEINLYLPVNTAVAVPGQNERYTSDLTKSPESSPVKTSIIIPVYNEEAALPLVLQSLFCVLNETYEVIVIDDGSTDQSVEVALKFACRLVRHSHNYGKGAALQTGLDHAFGQKIIFIDADNTYPIEMIPALVKLLEQYDLVRGIRQMGRNNIPFLNRIGNGFFDHLFHILHAIEGGDLLSGMYGGDRDKLLGLGLRAVGFDIEAEINVKAQAYGLTCATLPITYMERVGDKKLKVFRDGMRILYRLMQLTVVYNPLLIFILPGLSLFLIGILGVGYGLIWPISGDQMTLPLQGELLIPITSSSSISGDQMTLPLQVLFALAVVGMLGVQLMVFGLGVYSAGMAHGLRGRANATLDTITVTFQKRLFMLSGWAMLSLGGSGFIWFTADWLSGGQNTVQKAILLIITSLILLIGVQVLSASAFITAIKGLQSHLPFRKH